MSTNNHKEWKTIPCPNTEYHSEDCWRRHHQCAIKKIEELEETVQHLRRLLNDYDIAVFDDYVVRVTKKK